MSGLKAFTDGISAEWLQSFEQDPISIGYRLESSPSIDENAGNMASFLNCWQKHYAHRRTNPSKKIMLVIDGLDEITENNEAIWSFIPKSNMLSDGVYILLTCRNSNDGDIPNAISSRVKSIQV